MSSLASWFGGPSPSSHRRASSPKRRPRSPAGSTASKAHIERTYSPSGSTHNAFVRPRQHSPSRRASSPHRRPPSPTRSTTSTRSFFFSRPHTASTSSYKRRPRDGYITRLIHNIKRLLRDLIRYTKENPVKMFTLVVLPLITGGALTKLLGSLGIRLPAGLAALAGGMGKGGAGQGMMGEALGGIAGGMGGMGGGGVQTALGIAKMFM